MTDSSRKCEPETPTARRQATFLQLARIVVSMLFMVGRNRDYGPDAPTIGPARLIVAVILGAAGVIAALVLLATFVAR